MTAFNAEKYIKLQTEAIQERLSKFTGRLYFEIGGKFLLDPHAARVLPGYDIESKLKILNNLKQDIEILFCLNSEYVVANRTGDHSESYTDRFLNEVKEIEVRGLPKPKVVFNFFNDQQEVKEFSEHLKVLNFKTYFRKKIANYPNDISQILGKDGFEKDDHVDFQKKIILVCALGSNNGKMSTCMGQVYLDRIKLNLDSGYAKYETFPIWNIELNNPINIAYEAATADIGDYNVIDHFYQKAYGKVSINYNRDVDAYPILDSLIKKVASRNNYMQTYKSPTDMGINTVGFCIDDMQQCKLAAIEEIERRLKNYKKLFSEGKGREEWVKRCEELLGNIESFK